MGTKNRFANPRKIKTDPVEKYPSKPRTDLPSIEIVWPFILAILILWLYSGFPSLVLWIVLIVAVAIVQLSPPHIHMRPVDWSVLLISAFEMPSILVSQYRANSVRTTEAVLVSALIYYAVRITIRTPRQIACISGILGLGGAWLALSGLSKFNADAKLLSQVGLTDLVAFRSRIMSVPAPWVLGEWLTVLLLALPFACVLPLYCWQANKQWLRAVALPAPLLIVAVLLLSCSRAVVGSTVFFCFASCALMTAYRVISFRTGVLLLASALGALLLILACENVLYPGIFRAYVGKHASQIRSAEGRIETWKRSFELVRAHPLFGIGSSNAPLALLSTADQEETTGFSSRTFSLPVQVLVEKGSVGLIFYAGFLLLVCREFISSMRGLQPSSSFAPISSPSLESPAGNVTPHVLLTEPCSRRIACCLAAGLTAVLFRELTYSSVLDHTLTLTMVSTLSALLCGPG
jgi:O-antigen ligase